ncbi:hypothetical protein W97_07353 [Coniosporium apollinis CBS 100218]|uniref:Ornithine decarboxylase antizyme n=1 Tax=Coniosporium apollinis (strain CBS 100218) TaxID=1168221 RepID=R7Z1Q3_CONA1|nr:uncharacterized protein W97_07353 [Coniosporium apollinis CBS 100218]EON67856.1 hypothetical protein W97_07353 [Coniosporium apollinis CBS 100218]
MPLTPLRRLSKASTTLPPGLAGSIGVPEVGSGIPSPPLSPPLAAAQHALKDTTIPKNFSVRRARRGGAAYTIAGECERLFCETLKTVFLGEGNLVCQDSLAMGVRNQNTTMDGSDDDKGVGWRSRHDSDSSSSAMAGFGAVPAGGLQTPSPEMEGYASHGGGGMISTWVEVWDYVGGARFRGFLVDDEGERTMFTFFDEGIIGRDLKPGLMALLELCSIPEFDCSRLVVCIDRNAQPEPTKALMRDLGWVGFEAVTLARWTHSNEIISDRWVFLGMDV